MDKTLRKALASLPHGPEFRFVDRLLKLEPGLSGMGEYTVRGDEHFLSGHFPGEPLFPGVLLIEAAAQVAWIVAQSDPKVPLLPALKLTALKGIKISGTAKTGEVVRMEARITGRLANLIQAEISVRVADRIVLEGSLTLSGNA